MNNAPAAAHYAPATALIPGYFAKAAKLRNYCGRASDAASGEEPAKAFSPLRVAMAFQPAIKPRPTSPASRAFNKVD
jgi:hypothetical protein